MKTLVEKLRQGKQRFIIFVQVRTFLLSSQKRQNYLIMKNASAFLGLTNLAKNAFNDGDTASFARATILSFKYLGNFALYCHAKGLDQVDQLKAYAPAGWNESEIINTI